MPDFSSLLSTNMDTVEKPKPVPAGQYHGTITNYELGDNNKNKTPYCRVFVRLDAPGDGIDPDELSEVGDISKKVQRSDFYMTPESLYRLKDFMATCGIDTTGRSFGETLPELKDQEVLIDIAHRNSPDGSEIYTDVKKLVGTNG